jgi:glucose-6-phosphate isomerase
LNNFIKKLKILLCYYGIKNPTYLKIQGKGDLMEAEIKSIPFYLLIDLVNGSISKYTKKIEVRLSDMKPYFYDINALNEKIEKEGNYVIYEYYENSLDRIKGLNFGITIIHPGSIGKEYHFTRGHFHLNKEADEIYIGIKGKGLVLLDNGKGEFYSYLLERGTIIYIPGDFAHRTINIGDEDLVYFYIYPSDAGHDYESIQRRGFKKLVLKINNKFILVDNPRY